MPISLIDSSSREIVNQIESSTPRKTPSSQFLFEKTDDISSFIFKDAKTQHSTPIRIKQRTPTQNKFASNDSTELDFMNIEDNVKFQNR